MDDIDLHIGFHPDIALKHHLSPIFIFEIFAVSASRLRREVARAAMPLFA
jgi:hypothetical protein